MHLFIVLSVVLGLVSAGTPMPSNSTLTTHTSIPTPTPTTSHASTTSHTILTTITNIHTTLTISTVITEQPIFTATDLTEIIDNIGTLSVTSFSPTLRRIRTNGAAGMQEGISLKMIGLGVVLLVAQMALI